MREALALVRRTTRALPRVVPTPRGWALLGVGSALVVVGVGLSLPIALSGGVLLIAVDVAGLAWALLFAVPVAAERTLRPGVLTTGEVLHSTLEVRRRSFGPGIRMLVRERLDASLTGASESETSVELTGGRTPARLELEVLAARRGRPGVGPATLRVGDPFGAMRVDRVITGIDEVIVVPRPEALAGLDAGSLGGAISADEGRSGGGGSADNTELREYRPGDPLRRVHWGQSAKRGSLQVRTTTQAQPPEATVVLDTRRDAYAAAGGDAAALFERAVVVAASVAQSFAARASRVSLVAPAGATVADVPEAEGHIDAVLIALADVAVHPAAAAVHEGVSAARRRNARGLTALVTAACSEAEAEALAAVAPGGGRGLLVLITPPDPTVRATLERAGWRVSVSEEAVMADE